MCGIYLIRNTVDGKGYVGQAVDVQRRWRAHRSDLRLGRHPNTYLQRAWNKHGEDAFEFLALQLCEEGELNTLEGHYIQTLGTSNRDAGYNLDTLIGERRVFSPETRAKMSRAKVGHKMHDKTKEALRAVHAGQPLSQERRDALRQSNLGRKASPETRAKLSESHKGYKPTAEAKANQIAAQLGHKHSPETRAKMSAASKGRKKSPEHVAAMRDAWMQRKAALEGVVTPKDVTP